MKGIYDKHALVFMKDGGNIFDTTTSQVSLSWVKLLFSVTIYTIGSVEKSKNRLVHKCAMYPPALA